MESDTKPESGESFIDAAREVLRLTCRACGKVSRVDVASVSGGAVVCPSCEEDIRVKEEVEKNDTVKPEEVFDEKTGIRRMRRDSLGFKKAGADDEPSAEHLAEKVGKIQANGHEVRSPLNRIPAHETGEVANYKPGTDPRRLRAAKFAGLVLVISAGLVLYSWQSAPRKETKSPLEDIVDPLAKLTPANATESSAAKGAAIRFFAASTVEDYGALVRDPERVIPLAKEFLSRNSMKLNPVVPVEMMAYGQAEIGERTFVKLKVKLNALDWREMFLEKASDGYRVDWESFVGYSDIGWRDFKQAVPRPAEPVLVRAIVSKTSSYKAPFNDPKLYQSLSLVSPNGDYSFTGYVFRGTDADKLRELEAILAHESKSRHGVTLRIRYPQGTLHRFSVEVVDYVRNSWLVPAE